MAVLGGITEGGGAAAGGGTGDVTGPVSATDNALARFDGTTGKIVQSGVVVQGDSGDISGVTKIDIDNVQIDGNTISSTDTNGNLVLDPNGTGMLNVFGATSTDLGLTLVASFDGGPAVRFVTATFSAGFGLLVRAIGLPDDTNPAMLMSGGMLSLGSAGSVVFTDTGNVVTGTRDVGAVRLSAGVWDITNGSSGRGCLRTGGFRTNLVTKTNNYTVTAIDCTVLFDTTGGNLTATLPPAASVTGQIYVFKNIGTGINSLTIDGDGSETIDGLTTQTLALLGVLQIQSTGTAWVVIGAL
jgi:hypothetical protein